MFWFCFLFFIFFFIYLSTRRSKRIISDFSQLKFTRDRGEEKTIDGIIKEEETKTNAFTHNLIMIVCTVHSGRLKVRSVALFFSLRYFDCNDNAEVRLHWR